ncbi:alpha/beta hydrolase-fold protein [Tenacibaculum sp. ZH5_bin.1]|uniref:alpha/beta hydrolase n=1 Tax=Tenacibaculum TaxID=104267 RepID=UPI0014320778|nr:alpha/beta hydrolase-fold protein [Tenacibaculum mesophilum]KAF9657794.1 alpha/beta hydrolase [Tenacibaculum mesophilum]
MSLLKSILFIFLFISYSCSRKENKNAEGDFKIHIDEKIENTLSATKKRKFVIPNSEVLSLKSKYTKKEYDIYIKLPRGYSKSKKQYPILVLTDAGYAFPLVSSIYTRLKFSNKIDEIIIVGISYAKGEHFGISRTRDYTPTYSPNEPNGYSKEARLKSGKANNFIMFMKNELIPYLGSNYKVDLNQKAFAGHSFGGLLANYMVISNPDTFDYYMSGSPSLWYHNKSIFEIEKKYYENNSDLDANLFMGIGALENVPNGFQMVSDMNTLEERLKSRAYKNLTVNSIVFPNEDHETVYPTFITQGLLWAFGKEKGIK